MSTFEGPPLEELTGIGALTLGGFVEEVASRYASREAVVFDDPLLDGKTVRRTYAELAEDARTVGRGLLSLGLQPGQAVGILMGNRPEAVASVFGTALAGGVAVLLSTFAPGPELANMLEQAEVVTLLTQERLLDRRPADEVAALLDGLPRLERIVALEVAGGQGSGPDGHRGDRTLTWSELRSAAAGVAPEELAARARAVTPADDALVIFSSGTTSAPKGILHGHRAPALQLWVQAQIFGRHEGTRMWTSLPIFWTAGLNTAVGATLAAGGCWVAQETFAPGPALALLARERVTEPYSLPHQTAALAEHPDWSGTDLSSLTCVFGKSAFARHPTVHGDTGWQMPVGYGLSETCAFFATHWWDTPRELTKRSMGRLLPGNRLRVIGLDDGRLLGPGCTGELAVQGPTLMRRYLGRDASACFDGDGFFHTGDTGSIDDDGYLHFAGRRSEMIKTGGANVSPAELEVQLRACPPVKLARIVGVPDPRLDELVVACIVLREGAELSEADVQRFLKERVASYKVPRRVLFFDDGEIPMTPSATKVRDDELTAIVLRRLEPTSPTPSGDR